METSIPAGQENPPELSGNARLSGTLRRRVVARFRGRWLRFHRGTRDNGAESALEQDSIVLVVDPIEDLRVLGEVGQDPAVLHPLSRSQR